MKNVIISYTGGVGKTIATGYLLHPRMPNAKTFAIESINQTVESLGIKDVTTLKGKDFKNLLDEVFFEDEAIIDVGASNVEPFLITMSKFENGANEFDSYIIPVTPEDRAMDEAIKTAITITQCGVAPDRIKFLLNKASFESPIEEQFPDIFTFVKKSKIGKVNSEAVIYESEVFEYAKYYKISLEELTALSPDEYKKKAKEETDPEARTMARKRYPYVAQAFVVKRNLDHAYKTLMSM